MWVIGARRHSVRHAAAQRRARVLVPKDDRRTAARYDHSVLIRPPSITKSAPVIFAERSLARKSTRSATSSGRVNRPVTKPPCDATTWLRAVSVSTPDAFATVAATPSGPSHSAVSTGPGLTVFIRIPLGPTSLDSAFEKFANAAFAAQ